MSVYENWLLNGTSHLGFVVVFSVPSPSIARGLELTSFD